MIWIAGIVSEHEFPYMDPVHIYVSFSISYAECDVITNLFTCIESSLVYIYIQQKKISRTTDFIFFPFCSAVESVHSSVEGRDKLGI